MIGNLVATWRYARYLIEFGLLYYAGQVVVPLRNLIVRGQPPRLIAGLEQTTTKRDIAKQPVGRLARLLSRKISSGGTTGVPVTLFEFYWVTALERMYALYLWSMAGWRPTHRTLVLRGNRIAGPTERRGRMLVVSSYQMGRSPAYVAEQVAAFRPQWVWAYPSVYFDFTRLTGASQPLPDLKGFMFTSEKLYAWQREELAHLYPGARILEWYASSEKAALAYRIYPDDCYHFVPSYAEVFLVPLEDGREAPRRCALLGTSYIQAPSRIVRYRTGDIAIVDETGVVRDILGREQEFVLLRDGAAVAFSQVIGSIHSSVWEDVVRFRIEQKTRGEIELYIEERSPDRREFLQAEFNDKIATQFDHRLQIDFHFGPVTNKRSASGKQLFFVQHLQAGSILV